MLSQNILMPTVQVTSCKSTFGYMFVLAGGAMSWRSKKQTCVSLSTAEAEHVALAAAAKETVWLGKLLSQSAIAMCKNPQKGQTH